MFHFELQLFFKQDFQTAQSKMLDGHGKHDFITARYSIFNDFKTLLSTRALKFFPCLNALVILIIYTLQQRNGLKYLYLFFSMF